MSTDKILDRIRKLLAMANDERGNDNERETALRQAHSLLTKYGLDLMDVEAHEREKLDPRGSYDEEGWSMTWTRTIRNIIARLFMCKYYYGRKISGTRQIHYFVGRESNAVTAMYMSAYVIENVLKEGRRLYRHNLAPETRSFAMGVATRLSRRVEEMIAAKAEEVASSGGTAIALLDLAKAEELANLDFVASWDIKESKSRAVKVDRGAYSAGYEHGGKISLNVQVARPDSLRLK